MAVGDPYSRRGSGEQVNARVPETERRRFNLLKRESQDRLGRDDLRNGEFLELLLDVWELHSGEYSRADLPQDATAPARIKCYCSECETARDHTKTGGDRSKGISWYACGECGSGVRLDLAPLGVDDG